MKSAKTLGPAATGVLLRLAEQGKKIFSVADAQASYNKSPKVTWAYDMKGSINDIARAVRNTPLRT